MECVSPVFPYPLEHSTAHRVQCISETDIVKTRKLTSGYCQHSPRPDFQSVNCQNRNSKSCLGQVSSFLFCQSVPWPFATVRYLCTPEYNASKTFSVCSLRGRAFKAENVSVRAWRAGRFHVPGRVGGLQALPGQKRRYSHRGTLQRQAGTQVWAEEHWCVCRNTGVHTGTRVLRRNTAYRAGTWACLQEHKHICRNTCVLAGTHAYL